MGNQPLITVVTVCFNAAATIGDTLHSVATQEFDDYEHLIIDGGSTDDTLGLIERMRTANTRVISEPDHGVYDAMNKGIAAARGSLVCFLNSDDFYLAGRVLSTVAARFRVSQADVLYGDIEYVDRARPTMTTRRWQSGPYRRRSLGYGWHPPHPAFFARTQLLRSVGGFATDLRIAADYELMVKALRTPDIHVEYVHEVMVRMREGGRSTSGVMSHLRGNWQSYVAMRRNGLALPALMVVMKPLRKLNQFMPSLVRGSHVSESHSVRAK